VESVIITSDSDKYQYQVYEDGTIYDLVKQRFMPTHITSRGYVATYMHIDGVGIEYGVHRVVLCAFTNKPIRYHLQVNHKDGNKLNNHISNLEWVTCSENLRHAFKHGLHSQQGEHNSFAKLTEKQVHEICKMIADNVPIKNIAVQYNTCESEIYAIRSGKLWSHISCLYEFNYKKRKSRKKIE